MLAAIDTLTPPLDTGAKRALGSLDEGLEVQPGSTELVYAKYRVLRTAKNDQAAVAFVESKAKAETDPRGPFRRMLVQIYRDLNDFAGAERVLRELLAANPKDSQVAANLVKIVALQAIDASERNQPDVERKLNEKVSALLREFRGQFPNDLAFLQAECDLAARRGDLARATAITQEMDKLSKNSVAGPLTRARIYNAQGRLREAVEAYNEALERNPRLYEERVRLGQICLKLGDTVEAIRQAKIVLDVDPDQPDAILLRARAVAAQPGPVEGHRAEAINLLSGVIKKKARFADAYHIKAELQLKQGNRDQAIATLKEDLAAISDDAAALAQLIQVLAESRAGSKPTAADLAQAKEVATRAAEQDAKGNMLLAVAVGYHKAGQLALALPWAEKAAARLDAPLVHLNYGDLLLSVAEGIDDPAKARPYFVQAVDQYDRVLKVQANSVEAINNKAWILHNYLGQSTQALELANAFTSRVDPATLPGEFFDTLGSIQEATGRTRDAEESYTKGLRKSPDHPVLNYHMGKLVAADRRRAGKANVYLEKALAGRSRLTPPMVADLDSMVKKLGMKPSAN
jgi:tetratricopeptide (TPR) repeat protein